MESSGGDAQVVHEDGGMDSTALVPYLPTEGVCNISQAMKALATVE